MFKKLAFLIAVTAAFTALNTNAINNMDSSATTEFKDVGQEYDWAKEAISALNERGVIKGMGDGLFMPGAPVTKEQIASMLAGSLELKKSSDAQTYVDVPPSRWSFSQVESTKDIMIPSDDIEVNEFAPERPYTRALVAASCVRGMGLKETDIWDSEILSKVFSDYGDIPSSIYKLCTVAAERGIIKGSDSYFRPNDTVTRAEASVLIYRMFMARSGKGETVTLTKTEIISPPNITAEQAKKWAISREADQRFIDIADKYWEYGALTGINPEIMYGQAAKETNFGKFSGNVKPEQNNWAGIKIYSPTGDKAEDHESFATPEDGVRAHFNHMSAYVGLEPIGQPHARYSIIKSLAWAGTVKYAEELGTKWAPDYTYGYSLIARYVLPMRTFG